MRIKWFTIDLQRGRRKLRDSKEDEEEEDDYEVYRGIYKRPGSSNNKKMAIIIKK